jgi:quercetin 2,3-dioxygenase
MINIIRSSERHQADFGWLLTHWHFSFADYHDPTNINWGALRMFNDDIVQGGGGFEPHPHRDMEIITYVLEGELEHKDSIDNRGVIHRGEVQVMSAGNGIVHAEYNHSKTEPVHFLQIWILPRSRGSKPRWEQRQFDAAQRLGRLLPVVSSGEMPGTLWIDQDAAIYISSLAAAQKLVHPLRPGRKAYLFVISGAITVNGQLLSAGDQARIDREADLSLAAPEHAELILLDLPPVP